MAERTSKVPVCAASGSQGETQQEQGGGAGCDTQLAVQAGFALGGAITDSPSVAFCEDGDLHMRLGLVTITMQPQYALWLLSALRAALAEAQEKMPDAFREPDDGGGA